MTRKDRSFASKVAKAGAKEQMGKYCPNCGEAMNMVHLVTSEKSEIGTWRFKEKFVGVCKCNQNEIYA